ncbi:HEAT repeat domain-containing protein [Novipirellula rosea]|uniref:HEAT repeat protein n=1 Tax=Novipirellula rosea TaxID=1031540 RepID=A0ABP8M387_9BACT
MKSIILLVVFLVGGSFAALILVAQDPSADGSRESDAVAKRQTLTTPTEDELRVIASGLLEEVRRNSDFNGSGGGRDTAYRAYHNVYYRIRPSSSSDDRLEINELHSGMVPYLLEPFGFQSDINSNQPKPAPDDTIRLDMFPYEAIPILTHLANNGQRSEIAKIAEDKRQNATVRMVCIYSLYRAGGEFLAEPLIEILKSETRLQRRLIILLSLRWADDQATEVLLDHIDDPNVEVATAAACALSEVQPDAALPKIKRLVDRDPTSTSSLALSCLGDWDTCAAKQFLSQRVAELLENDHADNRLDYALSALVNAADLPRSNWQSPDYTLRSAARIALDQYHDLQVKAKADRDRLRTQTESVRTQWMTATQIESMRRGEYRRLLGLQADGIVTAEESKSVHDRLVQVQAEVESLRKKLVVLEARLATVQICDELD